MNQIIDKIKINTGLKQDQKLHKKIKALEENEIMIKVKVEQV